MNVYTLKNKFAIIIFTTLSVSACGGSSSDDTFYSSGETQETTANNETNSETSQQNELSQQEIDGLLFMREEEELARDLYLDLYDANGLNVFKNISDNAETKHAEAILMLLNTYNLQDPSTGSL